MELKKIKYFLRIVDEGSLSKAAQSLYLTQPTLSRFLEKLESETGVPLFIRGKNNSLTLTEAGKLYLKTARQIDKLWGQLNTELALSRRQRDHIVFGVCADYLQPFCEQCAKKVMARYPEVSVQFVSGNSFEIQQMALEGKIHLGICAYKNRDPHLTYILCNQNEMDLVVCKDHPLAAHSYELPGQQDHRITLSDLGSGVSFALMSDRTILRETVEKYLLKTKYKPHVQQTYMRHGSIVKVLNNGQQLLGFCPRNDTSENLAYIALDPPFYYYQGICYPKKADLTPAEKMLVTLLQDFPKQRDLDQK